MGSIPPAESIEYPQREIANLITSTGVTPSNTDLNQLSRGVQSGQLNYKDDTGTANAYAANLSPAPLAYVAGLCVVLKIANANTGPSVININSLGNKNIVHRDGSALIAGELLPGALVAFIYDGTAFQLAWSNVVAGAAINLTASRTVYVNGTTGHDTNYDGTAATVGSGHGPFATIGRAITEAFKYNPSALYAITIQIADGTYNENGLATPLIPGPSIILNGNASTPANVLINSTSGNCFTVRGPNSATISNLKGANSSSSSAAFSAAGSGASLTTSNTVSGVCAGYVFSAVSNGSITVGSHNFAATFVYGFTAVGSGFLQLAGGAVYTISAAATVGAFVFGVSGGSVEVNAASVPTFVNPGNVTGKKYSLSLNAIINTQGQSTSYFPGTLAGTLATGGQYG